MSGASVVAYSICRRCAAVFPATRRCPTCDGDREAAAAIAAATAYAIEPTLMGRIAPPRRRRLLAPLLAVSAAMLCVGVGLGWLFAADARSDVPLTTSATDGADR
ncbi:MAG: hypothetical protein IPL61_34310 [Myxococcales bacterium]|nr:hypothetical protein [Myxococcales bacterium]